MNPCPNCGYHRDKIGRPAKIDEKKMMSLRKKGLTLRAIAAELGVSHVAVTYALKRVKDKKS